MWAVSIVHTDDSLKWQHRLRSVSSKELSLDPRGLKYLCCQDHFSQIGKTLAALPPGVVFLGSGSFHHLSYHLVSRYASQPLYLVVLDAHGDCFSAPKGYISCGSWLAEVLKLPTVQGAVLVGPEVGENLPRKVLWTPLERARQIITEFCASAPRVYVSIDKDVLVGAGTDWGSGKLTAGVLLELLSEISSRCRLVGADVCGEVSLPDIWVARFNLQDIRRNEEINLSIWRILSSSQRRDKFRISA